MKHFEISERMSVVLGGIAVVLALFGGSVVLTQLDRYTVDAKVFVVYDDTAIEFITNDGNTWLYETEDTEGVESGDLYKVTFKEKENTNIYDDEIVKYVFVAKGR